MQFFQGQPVKVEEAEVGWPRGEGEREGEEEVDGGKRGRGGGGEGGRSQPC